MKVLYLCHRVPYPPNKGEKIRAFHQLIALSERHEVDLFTLADRRSDFDHQDALARYCRQVKIAGINPISSRLRSLPFLVTGVPLTVPYFYSAELHRSVRNALSSRSYDRVFIYCSAMAQYIDEENEIPVVADLVDVDSDKWEQYAKFSAFPISSIYRREARCLREYERRLCERASSTLLTTEREAHLMREICPGARIRVISNGVDTEYFKRIGKPSGSPAAPAVVFTGDMSYFPNEAAVTYFAREVFPAIRKSIANVRFLIVGRDPTNKVRQLQKLEGVEVTGPVPDVRPYLERAQVSVAPFSLSAGIPNKILEAMAFGLPVVGTACAVQGLSPQVAATVDIAGNAEEFARKTVCLLSDPELARSKGAESRRRVAAAYQWSRSIRQLLDVVENPCMVEVPATAAVSL